MTFPIKQIAINQFKHHTEQQDRQSFHNSNQCITSFSDISEAWKISKVTEASVVTSKDWKVDSDCGNPAP